MIHECFRVVDMTGGILNLFPWVRHFFPTSSGYKPLLEAHQPLWSFLQEVVNETKVKSPSDRPKSFINSYLEELTFKSNGENIHPSFSGTVVKITSTNNPFWFDFNCFFFTDEQLLSICLDFFQAGTQCLLHLIWNHFIFNAIFL